MSSAAEKTTIVSPIAVIKAIAVLLLSLITIVSAMLAFAFLAIGAVALSLSNQIDHAARKTRRVAP